MVAVLLVLVVLVEDQEENLGTKQVSVCLFNIVLVLPAEAVSSITQCVIQRTTSRLEKYVEATI